MTSILLLLLAALSIHRVWNFEDIAVPVRVLFPWKPFSCPACNAFWIAALVAAAGCGLGLIAWPLAIVFPFAAYLPLRASLWLYDRVEGVPMSAVPAAAPSEPAPTKPGCSSCQQKQNALADVRTKALTYSERIVILTARLTLDPQIAMLANVLAREKTRQVQVWLSAAVSPEALDASITPVAATLGSNVVVRAVTPFAPDEKVDQLADEKTVAQLSGEIGMHLMNLGNAKVVTIDALHDPHLLPLAQAIHQFGQTKAFGWVHFASGSAGWERPADAAVAAARATLPKHHRLVVPALAVAQAIAFYQADAADVLPAADGRDVAAAAVAAQIIV